MAQRPGQSLIIQRGFNLRPLFPERLFLPHPQFRCHFKVQPLREHLPAQVGTQPRLWFIHCNSRCAVGLRDDHQIRGRLPAELIPCGLFASLFIGKQLEALHGPSPISLPRGFLLCPFHQVDIEAERQLDPKFLLHLLFNPAEAAIDWHIPRHFRRISHERLLATNVGNGPVLLEAFGSASLGPLQITEALGVLILEEDTEVVKQSTLRAHRRGRQSPIVEGLERHLRQAKIGLVEKLLRLLAQFSIDTAILRCESTAHHRHQLLIRIHVLPLIPEGHSSLVGLIHAMSECSRRRLAQLRQCVQRPTRLYGVGVAHHPHKLPNHVSRNVLGPAYCGHK